MSDTARRVNGLSSSRTKELLGLGLKTPPDDQPVDLASELRRMLSSTDAATLQTAVEDLRRPVLGDAGPFAFKRLTGISPADAAALHGQTFVEALTSATTLPGALECLARYGQFAAAASLPETTRLIGCVIHVLARAALAAGGHGDASEVEAALARTLLRSLATTG